MRDSQSLNRGLIAVLVGGALLAVGLVVSVEVTGFGERDRVPAGVVATVNGIEVTEAEWEYALLTAIEGVESTRQLVENSPKWASDEMVALFKGHLELAESTPAEVRALGSLMTQLVVYAEALRRGFEADEAAVREAVEGQRESLRELLEEYVQPPSEREPGDSVDLFLRVIEQFDEERYWAEIVPRQQRRLLTIEPLARDNVRVPQPWEDYVHELVRQADLVVGEDLRSSVSVRAVMEFLERSYELSASHRTSMTP